MPEFSKVVTASSLNSSFSTAPSKENPFSASSTINPISTYLTSNSLSSSSSNGFSSISEKSSFVVFPNKSDVFSFGSCSNLNYSPYALNSNPIQHNDQNPNTLNDCIQNHISQDTQSTKELFGNRHFSLLGKIPVEIFERDFPKYSSSYPWELGNIPELPPIVHFK